MATGTISHPNSLHRVSSYRDQASTTATLAFPYYEIFSGTRPMLFGFLVITRYNSSTVSYSNLYYLTMSGNAVRASLIYADPNILVTSFELGIDAVLTVTFPLSYMYIQLDAYYPSLI